MNQNKKDSPLPIKGRNLSLERKKILTTAPEKALEHILDSPRPATLVQSFPQEDFYLLVHDIGPEDALPVIALASEEQWEYILDMDIWTKDRIDIPSTGKWLGLLAKADFQRSTQWLAQKKTDLLELYLFRNVEVRIREHDQDPSELGEDFFTFDNYFYIRILPPVWASDSEGEDSTDAFQKDHKELLQKLIKQLAALDFLSFQKILLEAVTVLPAEMEEELYRLRNVRMAEQGFLPFEEALGVYQPLSPEDLEKSKTKLEHGKNDIKPDAPLPFRPISLVDKDNLFSNALAEIDSGELLERLQFELISLSNRVIVADQKKIQRPEDLKQSIKKVCGFVNIGLESLGADPAKKTAGDSIALMKQHLLSEIFRVGYGAALKIKWRTERWVTKSWFIENGLPITFWGETWMGVLGGILIKRPLFFDNYKSGIIYREFNSLEEIRKTETVVDEIVCFDRLLSLMDIRLERLSTYGFLTYKNLLLTLWMKHHLGRESNAKPVDFPSFKSFFADLWDSDKPPRKVLQSMKEKFLQWLSGTSGLTDMEISENMGLTLENLFNELDSEYGDVSVDNLDPRYIPLFLMEE